MKPHHIDIIHAMDNGSNCSTLDFRSYKLALLVFEALQGKRGVYRLNLWTEGEHHHTTWTPDDGVTEVYPSTAPGETAAQRTARLRVRSRRIAKGDE